MKPRKGPTRFSSPENSKFFCWTDVDDATSALDGRGMTLRITRFHVPRSMSMSRSQVYGHP
jgi:hypothetical protein